MDGERRSCTERILTAIEYGKLPNDETERRLCELVEAEVNKTDSEADMELIAEAISLVIADPEANTEKALEIVKGLTDRYPLYEMPEM